ncbi:MAG: FAD-dependent oxidoreductase [Chloroflexi bacterium]|nr:FAD-dependent oxidoreductase [Chloroflexota bacterium]
MAGLGAAMRLRNEAVPYLVFDANPYYGGHTASERHEDGFVFDDGPHVSFTRDERIRGLFTQFVEGREHRVPADINNYWRGLWLTHPVQMNLRELPADLVVPILVDFIEARYAQAGPIANYQDWLLAAYGATFARTFPEVYGRKYHTIGAEAMTTDWLGPRMYRPGMDEILRGAFGPQESKHYVTEFRYPDEGGFVSYLSPFAEMVELRLGHKAVGIDPVERQLTFANGHRQTYGELISSIPLPALVPLIAGTPTRVQEASRRLSFSSVVIVNLGIGRDTLSDAHISYFYDEDIVFARLNFPHLLSPGNTPADAGSIQAEVYRSERYKPLTTSPEALIPRVVEDLRRTGVLTPDDTILHSDAHVTRFANVIYDTDREPALAEVQRHLDELGIVPCGRYGDWNHDWTDESFASGERAAERVLARGISVRTGR